MMVRFPSEDRAGAGYHIEASYPSPDGQRWLVNVRSRARGLLALFLLTDVGPGVAAGLTAPSQSRRRRAAGRRQETRQAISHIAKLFRTKASMR
jgi:hypothetical protein